MELEARDEIFQEILGDYPFWRVKKAFTDHIRQRPEIPAPADIIRLMEQELTYERLRLKYADPE